MYTKRNSIIGEKLNAFWDFTNLISKAVRVVLQTISAHIACLFVAIAMTDNSSITLPCEQS
jgi:hypothetical protein